jgi:hypothetical protein
MLVSSTCARTPSSIRASNTSRSTFISFAIMLPWARPACYMFPHLDSSPISWRRVFHHRCFWIFSPVSTSILLPLSLQGSVRHICHVVWYILMIPKIMESPKYCDLSFMIRIIPFMIRVIIYV